jgi:hypothetical protein
MEQRQDNYIMGPQGSNRANGNEMHIIFYMNQGCSGERCGQCAFFIIVNDLEEKPLCIKLIYELSEQFHNHAN